MGTATSTSARVLEVIPGRLHRIYGVLPLDGSISWAAPGGGVDVVSLYAISSPDGVLLVDSGLPVHRAGILDSVRSIVGDRPLSIIVTRMEPDTLGNLYYLLSEFDVQEVAAVAPAPNPFDFANAFPMSNALAPDAAEKLMRLPPEGVHTIQGVQLEVIRAPLRVLATAWLFLADDGVLLSSDSFGNAKLGTPDDAGIVDGPLTEEELRGVSRHISAKYGWLHESDAETVLEQTEAVIDARPVQMLAPTHGKVIRGRDAVASYIGGLRGVFRK